MEANLDQISERWSAFRDAVSQLGADGKVVSPSAAKWLMESAAAQFHLQSHPGYMIVAVIGGTGTGKSTVVNRLLESDLSAASLRRTFTGGPVAVSRQAQRLPTEWLGVEHVVARELPTRGESGRLTVISQENPLLDQHLVLIDTPDLDGDRPAHHAEADRVFRWSQAIVFLVTPEKYQMPELLPYYRLARRYALPALFLLNKCEEQVVLEDYQRELGSFDWPNARVFAIPRDEAAYEPPKGAGLSDLREALTALALPSEDEVSAGARKRCGDLIVRLTDQVLSPLRSIVRDAQGVMASIRALQNPAGEIDVSPLTVQLQRRMQEQSILYLMGPSRALERIRRIPVWVARLPRTAWDALKGSPPRVSSAQAFKSPQVPDFRATIAEQFTIVQSRIDDLLRGGTLARWPLDEAGYLQTRIDAKEASQIADEELQELQRWLEHRWNSQPRDTRALRKLLDLLPGGERLTRWSEAVPYLLVTSLLVWHPAGWVVSGAAALGLPVAADLLQELSDEVRSRTRETNRRIGQRFDSLVARQVDLMCAWIQARLPRIGDLQRVQKLSDDLADLLHLT